jgi:hypothetical protein
VIECRTSHPNLTASFAQLSLARSSLPIDVICLSPFNLSFLLSLRHSYIVSVYGREKAVLYCDETSRRRQPSQDTSLSVSFVSYVR